MSSKPKPTTTRPITAPPRKAICSALFKLCVAPFAVLLLALVAVFIPKNPHNPEKKPPVRNATGTKGFWIPSSASTTKMMNKTTNTIETVLYWRVR